MTVTRSSGSGMRDLPCAGDGNSRPGFSRPRFQHQLLHTFSQPARKDTTNRNLLQQKLYCLHLQEQEQEQESKRENGETPSLFKENYPPPRTCHSLIGCSPSAELSSRGRQSTCSGKLPLAHAQIICLPLRTQDVSAILQRRM